MCVCVCFVNIEYYVETVYMYMLTLVFPNGLMVRLYQIGLHTKTLVNECPNLLF